MMISKKYINHDQLNKEKSVLLLVKPNGGFMAFSFFTCMHGDVVSFVTG